jgi:hypothetical protein
MNQSSHRGIDRQGLDAAFQADSCWAQAGHFHQAIRLGTQLLAHSDLPTRLRPRVQEFTAAQLIRVDGRQSAS